MLHDELYVTFIHQFEGCTVAILVRALQVLLALVLSSYFRCVDT